MLPTGMAAGIALRQLVRQGSMRERAHQQLRTRKAMSERRFKLIETGFHAHFAHVPSFTTHI